jgi:hypothetical protein
VPGAQALQSELHISQKFSEPLSEHNPLQALQDAHAETQEELRAAHLELQTLTMSVLEWEQRAAEVAYKKIPQLTRQLSSERQEHAAIVERLERALSDSSESMRARLDSIQKTITHSASKLNSSHLA